MFFTLILGAVLLPAQAMAQDEAFYTECPTDQAECWVEWHSGDFNPIPNALRNTIANDTLRPDNRIYMLERGGIYYVRAAIEYNDFHLRLVGDPNPPAEGPDFGPPVIQLTVNEDGSENGRIITVGNDLTMKNVWVTNQDTEGSRAGYLPIFVEAQGARITVDNSVFERSNFSLFGFSSGGNKVYFTNNVVRNHDNKTQQWEGRGLVFSSGADSVIVENNTFFNLGMTVIQSEVEPLQYARLVHNTMVNIGRMFNTGGIWQEAYIANNLNVNHYWHGEGHDDIVGDRDYPYTGYFTIAPMPPAYGLDAGRRIVYTNNSHWRDPQFEAYYADTIRSQPLYNAQTDSMFENFDAMYKGQDFATNPGLVSYTEAPEVDQFPETSFPLEDLVPEQIQNIQDLRTGQPTPFNSWLWDPGRDPDLYVAANFVWPLPENFTYSNSDLMDAGTDGLPLGDLNWQDESAMSDWESNRDTYVEEIEALAGDEIELVVVGEAQAEDGSMEGEAAVDVFDGFAYYMMEAGGFIEWTFDVETAGTYDLNVLTNLEGNGIRGQRVILTNETYPEGLSLKDPCGWGEYLWDAVDDAGGCNPHVGIPTEEWVWTRINNSELHPEQSPDGLVLPAGTNTLRLEPSWGYQSFSTIEVLEAGTENVAIELTIPNATANLVQPNGLVPDENGEAAPWVATGFKSVNLGSNGSVTMNLDFPSDGTYLVRGFYQSEAGGSGTVSLNGTEVSTFDFVADEEGSNFLTDEFEATAGAHTVTVAGSGGSLDYVQLIEMGVATSNEISEMPEGYELSQNYPNPFNPTTKINYTIPEAANVQLSVYNILGQKVATLMDGRQFAGSHTVNFDASNLASGVYFYQLKAGEVVHQRKMTLIK